MLSFNISGVPNVISTAVEGKRVTRDYRILRARQFRVLIYSCVNKLFMNQSCFMHEAVIALAGFEEKFRIENRTTSQGLPYDFSSIMHFRHNAFSRDNKSTVFPRSHTIPKTFLGMSATGTDLDFLHLNILYCGGTCTDTMFIHSYVDISCKFSQISLIKKYGSKLRNE